jgi:uncharacterized Tic20 family protein
MNTMSLTHDAPNQSERIAVLVAHGGTLFAWFLAPLLVYLVKRNDSRYVEFEALQSLLWSIAGTLVAIATCGLAIPVFLVWHLYAAWTTAHGDRYEYPIVGDLARGLLA